MLSNFPSKGIRDDLQAITRPLKLNLLGLNTIPSYLHMISSSKKPTSDFILVVTVGSMTPDTHGRPHGLRLQGRPSPREGALRGTILLGDSRKARGGYPEDVTRSDRIRMISCFL